MPQESPSYFIVSYTAFSIPVVAAGVATTHVGLHRSALVYCGAIVVLSTVAAGSLIFRGRPAATPPDPAEGPAAPPSSPGTPTAARS